MNTLYVSPSVLSLNRLHIIFQSSPVHINIEQMLVNLGAAESGKDYSKFEILLKFKNIEVVSSFAGVDTPQTVALLEAVAYSQVLELPNGLDFVLPLCYSHLQSKSSRYFFSSVKDTLIYKERPFWFSFHSVSFESILPHYLNV